MNRFNGFGSILSNNYFRYFMSANAFLYRNEIMIVSYFAELSWYRK